MNRNAGFMACPPDHQTKLVVVSSGVRDQPGVGRSVYPTPSARIYLRLLLRRGLDTTIGLTEPGVSILGLSRPRTADSLGLRLW